MLDFTSSLYLGLRHPAHALEPWESLTTGAPAALAEPAPNRRIALALAELQGCQRGILAPSTLHLFWDLFGMLGRKGASIFVDEGAYPIARWGIERAMARGARVRPFRHHDPDHLHRLLAQGSIRGMRPLVMTDGFCPGCGRLAPVADYLFLARSFGGLLIIDDTQALGVFGHTPGQDGPYGRGGGGVLRWSGISGPDILVISSLAKGFGAPLAVFCGSRDVIGKFEHLSETRVHCSAPSAAAVSAAERALAVNRHQGENLRFRLAGLVSRFRHRLSEAGLAATGGFFPVQTLKPVRSIDVAALHSRLISAGVNTVLHESRNGAGARISFIITALHEPAMIDHASDTLAREAQSIGTYSGKGNPDHERFCHA